jgi:hypothetical protein
VVGFKLAARASLVELEASRVPGPGEYPQAMSCGKQYSSVKPTLPAYSLAGRELFGSTVNLAAAARGPSPQEYKVRQVNANETTAPKYSIFEKREHGSTMGGSKFHKSPGPGEYGEAHAQSCQTQTVSTKPSAPRPLFGKDKRETLGGINASPIGPGERMPL